MTFEYHCVECARRYAAEDELFYVCPVCSLSQESLSPVRGALRIMLPYTELSQKLDRYEFLPEDWLPFESDLIPEFPVGHTPCMIPERLRNYLDAPNLFLKDDSLNPTGSLKDRASLLLVAAAHKYHKDHLIIASNGNSASSLASLSAAAGLRCSVIVPASMPGAKLYQIMAYGAQVIRIDGNYDQAYDLSLTLSQQYGWMNGNSIYNPFAIEGKKTVAIEIFQQLDYHAPNIIFIPSGDGAILSSVYKGFFDLFQLDLIEEMPRLIAVQPEKSNALVRALRTQSLDPIENADTIADSLRVRVARNGIMAVKDIHRSCGMGMTVTDREILDAQQLLGSQVGLFVEPAAACALAGYLAMKSELIKNAMAVVLLTGSGLKDPEAFASTCTIPDAVEADPEIIAREIQIGHAG